MEGRLGVWGGVYRRRQGMRLAMTQDVPNRFSPRRPDAPDPLVGTVVNDRFRITRVVAIGGMGRIYEAEQLPLGRRVALKVLHQQYTQSADDVAFKKRFFLEASILSKLQHPNIVTVFDYGRIDGIEEAYYMVMEFLPGETLHARLERQKTLPAAEAIGLARQLARGLREAHRHNVVHRDLKPSNVMILPQEDGSEQVKVVDFGLVKVLTDDSDHVTKDGTFLGSPRYMSPEQIAHGHVDHRTDVYSLGVIMYQCLCGAVPFDSDHAVQTLMAHLNTPVPPMSERVPGCDVPPMLEDYVRRCLSKSPEERPASMEAVVRDLGELQNALGLGPPLSGPSGVTRYEVDTGPMNRGDLPATATGNATTGRLRLVTPEAAGNTVQPVADPTLATSPAQKTRKRLAAALIVSGLLATAAAGGAVALGSRSGSTSSSAAATASSPSSFVLTIDSTPSGAEVLEGSKTLGRTPLQLTIDNQAVAGEPRRLVLQALGYQPFPIVQGPSDQSLRIAAALVASPTATASAEPPPTATTTVATPATPVARTPAKAPSSPASTKKGETKAPDSDIRLNR